MPALRSRCIPSWPTRRFAPRTSDHIRRRNRGPAARRRTRWPGDPARVTFLDLAKAAACAARAVNKGGRIALLTEAAPVLGEAAEWVRKLDDPRIPTQLLVREKPADGAAAKLWCAAARHASLFLA